MPTQWGDKLQDTWHAFQKSRQSLKSTILRVRILEIIFYMIMLIIRPIINLCKTSNLIHIKPRKWTSWIKTIEILKQLSIWLIKSWVKIYSNRVYNNIESVKKYPKSSLNNPPRKIFVVFTNINITFSYGVRFRCMSVWPLKLFRKNTGIWEFSPKIKVGWLPYLALLRASPMTTAALSDNKKP
jgi:hypothetical protein